MTVSVIVAAAGQGRRMQEKINKQYLLLKQMPLLARSLQACIDAACFSQIIVVVTPGEEEIFRRDVLSPWFSRHAITVVAGGEKRQDSVRNGLAALDGSADIVCTHDGARPLTEAQLFKDCLQKVKESGSAVAAVPVKDTIKKVAAGGKVLSTPPREQLWAVQTPQFFRRDWLEEAHARAFREGLQTTDDAALLEYFGYPVFVVRASYANIKVTTPEDLIVAEALLERRQIHENRNRI